MNNAIQEASYKKTAFFLCLFWVQSYCRGHWMEKSSAEQRQGTQDVQAFLTQAQPGQAGTGDMFAPSTQCPVSQSLSQLPHCLWLRGHLLICALPIQVLPKSQDVTICLLLACIKLSVSGDSKTKFTTEDITGPVGLSFFPCPFAYPSRALSDTGHQPRCPLCRMDAIRDALLGGLLLLPSHSCLRP